MKQQLRKDELPKILYVYSDDDEALNAEDRAWYCLLSEEDLKDCDARGLVGIYELNRIGTVTTKVVFTVIPPKKGK